jgi:hypothetical protein
LIGVAVEKKGGPRFFPAGRTPGLFLRSLFGFEIVKLRIAGQDKLIIPQNSNRFKR